MSLYFDAVTVLSSERGQGSLKSRIYNNRDLKSSPAQIFALITETAKSDEFLKEVLDNSALLQDEPKLTPLLALLLAHDHFFTKQGIAAPSKHPIRRAFESHKARLQAEFTRARLRRKLPENESLKLLLRGESSRRALHPRWVRLNTLKTDGIQSVVEDLLSAAQESTLSEVLVTSTKKQYYYLDEHIPNLMALPYNTEITNTKQYRDGEIILQDKASCFPAYLLLGNEMGSIVEDVMDGCAAPGNKTTHLAAIMNTQGFDGRVLACERDEKRSETLRDMVSKAGAKEKVEVLASQDFLALHADDTRLAKVTHLLLDPSCSGSGIVGREDIPQLHLPDDPRAKPSGQSHTLQTSKKRKRGNNVVSTAKKQTVSNTAEPNEATTLTHVTDARLQKLSNLQSHIVEHAMSFPAAIMISYSTCSIHQQENEVVVSRVLASKVARHRGWRLLPRDSQVEGLRKWKHRGTGIGVDKVLGNTLDEEQLKACIRCYPDDDEGTMGFFVCAFVRDAGVDGVSEPNGHHTHSNQESDADNWEGFDD